MCDFMCVSELLSLSFLSLSLPVYLLLILMLIIKRNHPHFSGPFYRIATVLGIVDITTILHYYLFYRSLRYNILMPMHIWGGGGLIRYWLFMVFGSQRSQHLLVLATALNRYVALVMPGRHNSIWTRSFTNRVVSLSVAVGYVSFLVVPLGCEIHLQPVNGSLVWLYIPPKCYTYMFGSSSLLTFVLSPLFLALYGAMFIKTWRRAKHSANTVDERAARRKERSSKNLAIVGGVLSGLIVLNAIEFFVMVAFEQHYITYRYEHQALITVQFVVFSMINPWLLLYFAKKVRKPFLVFLGVRGGAQTGNGQM